MWSPPPSLAGGYTFAHIWHALRNDRRFDYAFYAEVALILVSRVMIRCVPLACFVPPHLLRPPSRARRLCSRLLVPLATVLILALGYAGLFVVSAGFLSRWPLVFYVNCCIGPIVLWKILRNYFLTVLTSPGYSSDALGKTEASNLEEQAHQNQCKKCQLPKPSRAHHCSVCNQCTLQMDHHCPFVNNCVGERNYRFFVRFLAWTSAGTAYLTALTLTLLLLTHSAHDYYAALTARTDLLLVPSSSALSAVSLAPVAYLNARLAQRFPSEVLLLVFVLALAGSVCVSVSILAAFHAYLRTPTYRAHSSSA